MRFPGLQVEGDLSVSEAKVTKRELHKNLITDHGSICARIINKYTSGVEFISLQLFHKSDLRTSSKHLATALEWCVQERIPIIHMSLGSSLLNDYYLLRPIIAKAIHQNQIVIAACSNSRQFSVPAVIGGVIAVSADGNLKNDEYRVEISERSQVSFFASSIHILDDEEDIYSSTHVTNSYAAPTITAKVHEYLKEFLPFGKTPLDVFKYLMKQDFSPRFPRPDFFFDPVIIEPQEKKGVGTHWFLPRAFSASKEKQISKDQDVILFPGLVEYDVEKLQSINNLLLVGDADIENIPVPKGFIWREEDLKNFTDSHESDKPEPDCAIIRIKGTEKDKITFSAQLKRKFINSGYQCLCVSDLPNAYLYDMEYQPKLMDNMNALSGIFDYYQPDVMIVTCAEDDKELVVEDLLTIKYEDAERIETLTSHDLNENHIRLPLNTKINVEKTFRRILRKLS